MSEYKLKILKNAIDVPIISGDSYPDDPVEANTYMFSAQLEEPFITDLTFKLYIIDNSGEAPIEVQEAITSVSITTPGFTGVTYTVTDTDPFAYKIRVSGIPNTDLGGSYSFVLGTDDDTKPFPTANNIPITSPLPDDYLAVFKFVPPTLFEKYEDDIYQISVTPAGSALLSQYIYWNWTKGIQNFKNLVASGEI
jgi:hypothetical protein